ncbi:homeobox-leucine zipper protein PROTODERMAL FACTOR 2-like [Gastrolobium bilobum]|uniref:homeobox-leucine zipper protein PROTODERMAL FACTOR 2-like n=1 Tax=Gastrolobium bilobum TaxID=150636 RepID=UPI002AB03258|nr:homeobox-leucine zipper protein PROTODERMAL FACTOR 2-like [Gastrolobium bilobum]
MERACDLLFGVSIYAEPNKSGIIDLACSAMNELSKIAVAGEPLWQPQKENRYETLNDIEYLRQFGQVDTTLREIMKLIEVEPQHLPSFGSYQTEHPTSNAPPRETLQIEASRDMAYINTSPINIVEFLMDVNQWSGAFYNIVSRTTILGTFSDGEEGTYDGKVHVMNAELHLPTPLVPTRECYFARYCKQLSHENWVVVDVSLEKFFPSPSTNFRRRPSGCLITGMPNGYSKVIWVEHVEADHSQLNNHFQHLVTSGLAFGATRWLASIIRHSEWLETLNATTLFADDGVHIPQAGRTSFLNLAYRMMRSFCADISASTCNPWKQLRGPFPDSTDVRVILKNNMEDAAAAKPRGTTVVFATSLRLEVPPNRLFNFLRRENSRSKWDLLSRELSIREFAYMTKGKNPGNRVSLMRANTSEDKIEIFYLQESCTDSTGSYVIYAPLDGFALSELANGCNPDNVIVLPSGFAILPAEGLQGEDSGTESLLTVAFHIMENSTSRPIPPESIETIHKIITETVTSIKDAVQYHNLLNNWIED